MSAVGFVVSTMVLKFGTAAYECAVTSAQVIPKTTTVTTATACATNPVIIDVGRTSWTLRVDFNADADAQSLYRLLFVKRGETATFTLVPDAVGHATQAITGSVKMIPASGTFKVNAFGSCTVELPIVGDPTWSTLSS